MKKIFIIGSCVSRDIFTAENSHFNLVHYNARSSFARIASAVAPQEHYKNLDNIASNFQKRMVKNDFDNKLIELVNGIEHDILLIDLIDERFHLAMLGNAAVTRSKEFTLTKIVPKRVINTFSDEYMDLWKKGVSKFFASIDNKQTIILPQFYWASHCINGDEIPMDVFPDLIKHNEKLNNMYAFIESLNISNLRIIDFGDEYFKADENHQWGLSPFHYESKYKDYLLNQMLVY